MENSIGPSDGQQVQSDYSYDQILNMDDNSKRRSLNNPAILLGSRAGSMSNITKHSKISSNAIEDDRYSRLPDDINNLTLDTVNSSTPQKNLTMSDILTKSSILEEELPLKDTGLSFGSEGSDINTDDNVSSKDIPTVTAEMTPWKLKKTSSLIEPPPNITVPHFKPSVNSPLNLKTSSRSYLNMTDIQKIANSDRLDSMARDINPIEYERMRRSIASLRMKYNALVEMIKQINLGDNLENEQTNSNRSSVYRRLLEKLEKNDDSSDLKLENEKLLLNISEKDNTIENMKHQLTQLQEENVIILNNTDEHIKTSENLCKVADNILSYIRSIDFKTFHLTDEEKGVLQTAIDLNSNYFPVKMNTLDASIHKLITNLQNSEENVLVAQEKEKFNQRGSIMANSTQLNQVVSDEIGEKSIDSNMEIVIQDLRKEYDNFIKSIGDKLTVSSQIENELRSKLVRQEEILHKMSLIRKEQQNNAIFDSPGNIVTKNDLQLPDNVIESKLDISYIDNIKSLNALVETQKEKIRDLEIQTEETSNGRNENNRIQRENKQLIRKIENLEEMVQQKNENWSNLTSQLEEQINHLLQEKEALEKLTHSLGNENKNNERIKEKLVAQIDDMEKHIDYYVKENEKTRESNDNLRSMVLQIKASQTNTINKLDAEFGNFNQNLLLHLLKVFEILKNIIERHSIEQSIQKVEKLSSISSLDNLKYAGPKFDVIYTFIEMALESIIQSYTNILVESAPTITNSYNSLKTDNSTNNDMQIKIDELQKRWLFERERRKLDATAAEAKITKLQIENDLLKEQIFNTSLKD
ncbi:similar to Kazachstania africana KAFR_0I00250 hypothetical protein [Maudiozyma saulgeensis]|uniref:Mto2p-binding domain-containing protein n=1 Tax=Maudiozyma saulgeensis TaxID=1789683 RepID=A0A1X7QZD1_9SACH|nr:similar to Kazachstania africana KAFR_0I00250 hypothetical protein [Kazachstania saulgeensis]